MGCVQTDSRKDGAQYRWFSLRASDNAQARSPVALTCPHWARWLVAFFILFFPMAIKLHFTAQTCCFMGCRCRLDREKYFSGWWNMLITPDAPILGDYKAGLSVPGAMVLGNRQAATQYIFIQNDTATDPASMWYVQKLTNSEYVMPNATAPKGSQYIGVFLYDVKTGSSLGRLDATAIWSTSNPSAVKIVSGPSSSGQIVISILVAGSASLVVTWGGLTSTLTINSS